MLISKTPGPFCYQHFVTAMIWIKPSAEKSEKQTDGTVKFISNGGMKQTTAPENALFTVNGITETESQTNEVKDAFGLTLTTEKTTGKTVPENRLLELLVVSSDIELAKRKFKEWVDVYNEYQKPVKIGPNIPRQKKVRGGG